MLTARVGGYEVRASKALKGKDFVYRCKDPNCPSPEMILVSGEREKRRPHFRHKSNCGCKFGVGETDWHREWKSHFDRVEVDMGVDPATNEHNYADAVVRDKAINKDVVIEFQHSPIALKEQEDRERFYTSTGGMVWVYDASGKRNCDRFDLGIKFRAFDVKGTIFGKDSFYLSAPDAYLPVDWIKRSVGVFLDYGEERGLIFILSGRMPTGEAVCMRLTNEDAVRRLKENPSLFTYSVPQVVAFIENEKRRRQQIQQQAQVRQIVSTRQGWFPKQFRQGRRGTWRM